MGWGWQLSVATFRRQWLQSLLLLLGLSLGTAVVVAVDLANQSAARSFTLNQQTFGGRSTHRIRAAGGGSVPESIYRQLRLNFANLPAAPLLEGQVQVVQWQHRPLRLLGIDPLAEADFRPALGAGGPGQLDALAALIGRRDTIMLSAGLSPELPADHRLTLALPGRQTRVEVTNLLAQADAAFADVLFADIGTAQQVLGRSGQLSEIDLILPEHADELQRRIQALLPPGITLQSVHSEADALERMSRAFRLNLTAMSLLALIVGMFLVYNTVSFSVLRRRAQFGTLRTLGVTRAGIFWLIVSETLVLGLVGSLLGIGLGIGLGQGLLQLMVRTINDLYYSLEVTRLSLDGLSLLKGVGGTLLAAVLATLLPAWEATRTPPAGVLRASTLEASLQPRLGQLGLAGLGLMLGGGALTLASSDLWFNFACFVLVVGGAALTIPWLARGFMLGLARGLDPVLRMAPRQLARSLSRTAVAMAALMVAVSVVISVSLMIGSFRSTLIAWLDTTLGADLFAIQAQSQPLPAQLAEQVRRFPGVARVETSRQLRLLTSEGVIQLAILSRDISQARRFVWLAGDRAGLWQRLEAGAVLVSQPFATHHGLRPVAGQTLSLPTDTGPRRFKIAGIYYDYTSDQGIVLLPAGLYRRYWHDDRITALSIDAAPGVVPRRLQQALSSRFAGPWQLSFQAQGEIKRNALSIFDRTFAITGALRLLAMVVAVMGIFSTLMALLLERRRSFAVLRALGLTPRQLGSLILFESGLMGLFSGLMALPLGVMLALFLIDVINLRSFGWTMDLALSPLPFVQGLALAVGSALLAGAWPAWRATREGIARGIRWE